MPEVWKKVRDFEDFYEVSNLGRVRSVSRIDAHGVPRGGHLMKLRECPRHGYITVKLCRDGKIKLCKVHRLVLEAFVGPCPIGMMSLHKDDVKTNNALENLRWGTNVENCADKIKNGTIARGERNGGGGKLTENSVRDIKSKLGTKFDYLLARDFGVSTSTIQDIKHGRSWAHV